MYEYTPTHKHPHIQMMMGLGIKTVYAELWKWNENSINMDSAE